MHHLASYEDCDISFAQDLRPYSYTLLIHNTSVQIRGRSNLDEFLEHANNLGLRKKSRP